MSGQYRVVTTTRCGDTWPSDPKTRAEALALFTATAAVVQAAGGRMRVVDERSWRQIDGHMKRSTR